MNDLIPKSDSRSETQVNERDLECSATLVGPGMRESGRTMQSMASGSSSSRMEPSSQVLDLVKSSLHCPVTFRVFRICFELLGTY